MGTSRAVGTSPWAVGTSPFMGQGEVSRTLFPTPMEGDKGVAQKGKESSKTLLSASMIVGGRVKPPRGSQGLRQLRPKECQD